MRFTYIVLLALGSCVIGCGGGGGDSDPAPLLELYVESEDARDGYIYSEDFTTGYVVSTGDISVGDNPGNWTRRGFVSFDVSPLAGRQIVSAELRLHQMVVHGAPFTALGPAVDVEHVQIGTGLDETDFDAPGLEPGSIGTITNSADIGTRTLDVTAQVRRDADAGRATSDFRLRFAGATNGNGSTDAVNFVDANDYRDSGFYPELVVQSR